MGLSFSSLLEKVFRCYSYHTKLKTFYSFNWIYYIIKYLITSHILPLDHSRLHILQYMQHLILMVCDQVDFVREITMLPAFSLFLQEIYDLGSLLVLPEESQTEIILYRHVLVL